MDARTQLRAALATFIDLAATPWSNAPSRSCAPPGKPARKRDPSTLLDLTPMGLKVAQLVSTRLSNKDVAAPVLGVTATVAFNLHNGFTKVGVSSRTELAHLDFS